MAESNGSSAVSKEAITAIIVTGIVLIFCILACSAVAIAFLINAPWG